MNDNSNILLEALLDLLLENIRGVGTNKLQQLWLLMFLFVWLVIVFIGINRQLRYLPLGINRGKGKSDYWVVIEWLWDGDRGL